MKRYSLIFIPQSQQGSARTLRIAQWHIAVCVALVFLFFVSCGLLGLTLTRLRGLNRELTDAGAVNARLRSDLEAQGKQIEEFATEMDSLTEFEAKIRDLTGMPPRRSSTEETRQGGQGGEESVGYEGGGLSRMSFLLAGRIVPTWTLPALLEEVRYRQETFSELIDHVTREQEQLAATPCIWPVDAPDMWISSGFGYRVDPISGKRAFHEGTDIVAPLKSPVVATADGVVTAAGWEGGLGWVVTINHGHGYKTRYGHNHKLLVKKGDKVRRGDPIALEGSTGRTTGPHVHYEVICDGENVNPYRYLVR
jgi:murein DD-endopeptidase MepM/ murein hydrolase activator NlpD